MSGDTKPQSTFGGFFSTLAKFSWALCGGPIIVVSLCLFIWWHFH